jgi:predicted DNA-binding transcriptional regulator AlpA
MAYDRKLIYDRAKEQIVAKRLIFVEEVVAFIGISKPTFYDFFPVDSNEFNELKRLIEDNKITLKTSMRKKWYDSDNASLQMGLMKLIATPEELRKLSMNHQVTEEVEKPIFKEFDLDVNKDNGTD